MKLINDQKYNGSIMKKSYTRYLYMELLIGAMFGAFFSLLFTFIIFGRKSWIPMGGTGGLVVDSLPQSFMILFMGSLVPTLMTRRRVRQRSVEPLGAEPSMRPANPVLRALAIALPIAGIFALLHLIVQRIGPAEWPFGIILAFKLVSGALLGIIAASIAVPSALRDSAQS